MKNLQNLKGAKALNKKEQQSINGGGLNYCTQQGRDCCETFPSGFVFCNPGYCQYGGCNWY